MRALERECAVRPDHGHEIEPGFARVDSDVAPKWERMQRRCKEELRRRDRPLRPVRRPCARRLPPLNARGGVPTRRGAIEPQPGWYAILRRPAACDILRWHPFAPE